MANLQSIAGGIGSGSPARRTLTVLSHLPFRYRIPLEVSAVVILSGLVVTLVLGWQNYRNLQQDLWQDGHILASAYRQGLIDPLGRHDIRGAQALIRTAEGTPVTSPFHPELVLVLDPEGRTLVSNRPGEFPAGSRPRLPPDVLDRLVSAPTSATLMRIDEGLDATLDFPWKGRPMLAIGSPVVDGARRLGTVLMIYSSAAHDQRFARVVGSVILGTGLLIVVLAPLGWLAGKKISEPLTDMVQCLDRLEKEGPEAARCQLRPAAGELGRVSHRLGEVLDQLTQKQSMEKQMIAEERLSAIGRLAAGVAHEVNNPLGGMMNALDTFTRHGADPEVERETIELLERGLGQIRHTVSALLTQSRAQDRPFSHQDVEDIRVLLRRDLERKRVTLEWDNRLQAPVDLPAGDLRQVLLNLLLNSVEAVPEGGHVRVLVEVRKAHLTLEVANTGEAIPAAHMNSLFAPFSGWSPTRTGLGLWVTSQLVERLNGRIEVHSDEDQTQFRLDLPLNPP